MKRTRLSIAFFFALALSAALSFSPTITSAQTSFEGAKTSYNGLHRSAESQVNAIEAESRAALAPILESIRASEKEREACTSFACADRLTKRIDELNHQLRETAAPYAERENAVRANLAQAGRELAIDAYAEEMTSFIADTLGGRVLSAQHGLACAGYGDMILSQYSACKMSVLEYRIDSLFYKTTIAYGLPLSDAGAAVSGLDELFANSRERFLEPEFVNGPDSLLRAGLRSRVSCYATTDGFENGKRVYGFRYRNAVGFITMDLQQTP